MICELQGIDPGILTALAGPEVVHFCGHRIGDDQRFAVAAEALVAGRVAEVVAAHAPGYGYGSLASGADILWAEALLGAGAELHVVLPFRRDEFVEISVASSGRGWVERFDRCLAAATTVRFATEDAFLGDAILFRYCAELAMGLALLRARYLDAEVRQLAIWDGETTDSEAGTAVDVATWRGTHHPVTIVPPEPDGLPSELGGARPAPDAAGSGDRRERVVRAILFGDIRGFSRMGDAELVRFVDIVLEAVATVLERHREAVQSRNTWGDAIYLVLTDAAGAAACALDIQDTLAGIDLAAEGLPEHLALRLGGHLGPVLPQHDPILGQPSFIGSHVSRTARIEPVTPPGAVYVTEPFAAALVLAGAREFACDYVGHMPAAKDYGRLRMYRLRRTARGQ
jgi:class 3 adenylate cyclase